MENKLDLKGKLNGLDITIKAMNNEYRINQKGSEFEEILRALNMITDILKDLVNDKYRRGMVKKQDKNHE